MWRLVSEDKAEYVLLAPREYQVGRAAGADIVVEEASVSRAHCALVLAADGSLSVADKSKFGTRVNNARMKAGETRELRDGDSVMFGVLKKMAVHRLPPPAVCLAPADAVLAQRAVAGGVAVVGEAASCSHLVLTRAAVQPRLLLAMALQRPVVSQTWLEALLARPLASSPWPRENDYVPPLELGSAAVMPARRTLLAGCVVCFPSERVWQRLAPLCRAMGAECLPPDELPPSARREGVAFVMPGDDDLGAEVVRRLGQLQSRRLPFVTAEDIAKAVLTCRLELPAIEMDEDSIVATPTSEAQPSPPKRARVEKVVAPPVVVAAAAPSIVVAAAPVVVKKKQEVLPAPSPRGNANGTNFKRFKKQPVRVCSSKLMAKAEMVAASGGSSQVWSSQVVNEVAVKKEESARIDHVWEQSSKQQVAAPGRRKK